MVVTSVRELQSDAWSSKRPSSLSSDQVPWRRARVLITLYASSTMSSMIAKEQSAAPKPVLANH